LMPGGQLLRLIVVASVCHKSGPMVI
jgi:hypothetical protein